MAQSISEQGTGLTGPMNVQTIVQKAENYDYNPLVPLKYWLRTAGTLLKEVVIENRRIGQILG